MSQYSSTIKYFTDMVSSAVNETAVNDIPSDVEFSSLMKLSQRNATQSMLYLMMKDRVQSDREAFGKLEASYRSCVVREISQQDELLFIREQFDKAGIDFMLLKGSHLKALYPAPEMRFMVDMDILVRLNDVDKAKEIILSRGFTQKMNNGKDIVLIKKPFLTIELHNSLFVEKYYMYDYFTKVWDRAEPCGNHEYRMTWNDLYIYTMAHLVEHYTAAGSCFRPTVDIYLMNRKCADELDFTYINDEFEKLKIKNFADKIKQLGFHWFSGDEKLPEFDTMEKYILLGPPIKNSDVVSNASGKSKLSLLISSAFPNMKHMSLLYPILKKSPFLLPVFWIVRAFSLAFSDGGRNRLKNLRQADLNDAKVLEDIYKKSGL